MPSFFQGRINYVLWTPICDMQNIIQDFDILVAKFYVMQNIAV